MCLIYYTWMLMLYAFHSVFWFKTYLWKVTIFQNVILTVNEYLSFTHAHSLTCMCTHTHTHARICTCPHACTSNDSLRFQTVGHSNINPQNKICHTQV
jgi:hypothetical protein